ncbi:hypothetical protein PF005_g9158 [Phytophthora fragariae]|uniref:Uncharacterized protein n=2 Tax=Phytophthora fragariae TaxID=53985 RepID=A0A6A3YCZ9_9STRA|nr:hypothetical protein PF009_g9813 [Phytophthora fragariae]KAE9110077.1 hypothetical protein PF007_g11991 [Phytophthora fragariae]KAE9143745.1 hypothetical protein PF006_g11248 [Phytophthora fragariae]KAE9216205.1 hypothetical protein PF005_g9158 [Phytophthora fragariae]KAE9245008.1 hypothetical protein PF002_g7468 [Phytophthora fragariae]
MGCYAVGYRAYMDGLSHAASNAGLLEGLRGNQASDQETEHDLRRALLCFCDFWLPALLSSYAAYVNFFKLALVNHANYSHGATKWNTAYTQRLLLDPVAQVFFFCLVFWVSASHCMAFLPVAANIDVAIGVAFILEMLTPARTFLLLVLNWQVLRVRYMISHQLQEALHALHATILTVVNPLCYPTVVGTAYGKIHAFAVKMGDAAQQQQAVPGADLASRCNVM